ncbi:MAG: flagellar filament capping protein FliD, partial [Clostridiaceae bacterium]|nr:flagellar filament capping protein FliD [Clostridiaceae bacterium]
TFLPVGVGVGKITLGNATVDNGLDIIGFTSGASFSNRLSTTDRLEAIVSKLKNEGLSFATVNDKEVVQLTINNKSFTFDKSMTLSSMMSQISSDSEANVNMKYDSIADKFVITSKQTGQGSNINISETGSNLLSVIDLSQTIAGEDAEAIVDGQFITRSNNTFAISGVSYTLLKETELDKDIHISLSLDVDKIFDNIKTFVGKYNELIGAINNELGEEYYKDYQPLTDEQKEVMSEEEIEKWEEKAKSGILRNDRALQKIVSDMRKALYEKIEGVPNGIAKIGITTGSYQENGKLVINETELRNAIQNTPDLVMNIFSKESSTTYFDALDDSSLKTARYVETGLAGRLYDIIQDSIRTIRNKDDKKGILLEIAGIAGDVTEFDSMIVDEIKNKDKQINEQLVRLYNKETAYYQKFASMESALSQMNSQSAWLSQQFGSSQW